MRLPPSVLACLLVLSLFRSCLGSHVKTSCVNLPWHFQETQSHSGLLSLWLLESFHSLFCCVPCASRAGILSLRIMVVSKASNPTSLPRRLLSSLDQPLQWTFLHSQKKKKSSLKAGGTSACIQRCSGQVLQGQSLSHHETKCPTYRTLAWNLCTVRLSLRVTSKQDTDRQRISNRNASNKNETFQRSLVDFSLIVSN